MTLGGIALARVNEGEVTKGIGMILVQLDVHDLLGLRLGVDGHDGANPGFSCRSCVRGAQPVCIAPLACEA